MTDAIDFDRADAGAIRFGWWKTHEHFCAPGSQPEATSRVSGSDPGAISRSGDLVLGDLRAHTVDYGKNPVIGVDFGDGWRYAYKAPDKDELVDSRIRHPTQPPKYNRVRGGSKDRGYLGAVPPLEELDIVPRDLDTSEPFASETVAEERELDTAIALGDEIERRYAERVVRQRLHQPELRRITLDHHGTACAYCGLDVPQIVEAAHLIADSEGGEASVQNTRPMCPNHHRAFDAGLLVWDGERFERADGAPPVGPAPREA